MKVYINPTFTHPDKADGGIRRVVEAQCKWLPKFGWDVVSSPEEADVIACHGASLTLKPDKPMVAHCHGLYWSEYGWDYWAHDVNKQVVRVMAAAVAHTAPSHWVNTAMRRGMLIYPRTIYHGVDAQEWTPGENGEYILWNKARSDNVSNQEHAEKLAAIMPNKRFISTIGTARKNFSVIGALPYNEMKAKVQNAGVYLATARETFGIGTLEALAAGVPVAGWDYGGQSEIIIPGETGYLAQFGDYEALAKAVELCFQHRTRLSKAARNDAINRWGWEKRIREYAEVYSEVANWWHRPKYKVTVIVTAYNLAQYLSGCLTSVLNQTFKDWECIVIDDCSTDNTAEVVRPYLDNSRFSYYRTPENLKLVGARNFGFTKSKGKYIIYLDADDEFTPNALEILAGQLDLNPEIHIASGHLEIMGQTEKAEWPFANFDWWGQMAHLNQMPYSTMMRREVMERSGGYRERCWRAEDAENWCRLTSFGFRAKKVTEAPTLRWRNTPNSKSKSEPGDGEWTAWFPWNLARTREDARRDWNKIKAHEHPNPDMVPWGAQGDPPKGMLFWEVPHQANPKISVIIPVGPGHEKYVINAVDSIMGQTMREWEVIVINDTGKEWPQGFESPVRGAPWAIVASTGGNLGAGAARNLGVKHARGEFLAFLDADDVSLPNWLEKGIETCIRYNSVVYTDWIKSGSKDEPSEYYETDEFECGDVLKKMRHAMTVILPKQWHEDIKGFDVKMKGWEDWDYLIALQSSGRCSVRLPIPGFVYMFRKGHRREASFDNRTELLQYIRQKWDDYYSGRKQLMCGCGKRSPIVMTKPLPTSKVQQQANPGGAVLLTYRQASSGRMTIVGPATRTIYSFATGEDKYVHSADAAEFLKRSTRGVPHFTRADDGSPATEPEPAKSDTKKPEFAEMPGEKVENKTAVPAVSQMNAREIEEATKNLPVDTIREMLRLEKEGRGRKGVILLLTKAMTNASS